MAISWIKLTRVPNKGGEIIKCRILCRIPDVNWLKISDIVRGTQLDHLFYFA